MAIWCDIDPQIGTSELIRNTLAYPANYVSLLLEVVEISSTLFRLQYSPTLYVSAACALPNMASANC
ncbi:putative D-lactate dehydrogenase mitochondrial [Bienertia sinuspersici]